jgi:hypothetical protein
MSQPSNRSAGQGQGFEPTGTGNRTCFAAGSTGLVQVGPFFTLGLEIIGYRFDNCWVPVTYNTDLISENFVVAFYGRVIVDPTSIGELTSNLSYQSICMSCHAFTLQNIL